MSEDILSSVFGDKSLDRATFESKLSAQGLRLVGSDEYSALFGKNSELLSELSAVKDESKIELLLAMSRVKNVKAARALLDTEAAYGESGLDDALLSAQLDKLKGENPWLFEENAPSATSVSTGRPHGIPVIRDTSRMSDDEYYKLFMKG